MDHKPHRDAAYRLEAVRIVLKAHRQDLQTVDQFANWLGTYRQRLNNWRKGEIEPPTAFMLRLKALCGVTTDWIYAGDASALPGHLQQEIIEAHKLLLEPDRRRARGP